MSFFFIRTRTKTHGVEYGKPNGAKFNKQNWPHVQQICYQGQE